MAPAAPRPRPSGPFLAHRVTARILQAHGYSLLPLGLSHAPIPASALPNLLRFLPDYLAWRPNRPPRLLDVKSASPSGAKVKLRALDAYRAWHHLTGLPFHLFLWSYASSGHLYAYPLDDLFPLLASRPVDHFPDSQDAFVTLPLPPQPPGPPDLVIMPPLRHPSDQPIPGDSPGDAGNTPSPGEPAGGLLESQDVV
jgi:hypothetical protein